MLCSRVVAEALLANPGDADAAQAAGEKAAAAVKRLPSDPLDKVARYEELKLAHGVAPVCKARREAPPALQPR